MKANKLYSLWDYDCEGYWCLIKIYSTQEKALAEQNRIISSNPCPDCKDTNPAGTHTLCPVIQDIVLDSELTIEQQRG